MARYTTILFDFDGTIMNTMDGITRGVQYALEHLGLTPPPQEELVCFIGPSITDGLMEFFGLDLETAQRGTQFYREYYRSEGLLRCEPYPGMVELLTRLHESGFTVALATSKPLPFAEGIMRAYNLLPLFDVLSGAGANGEHNTKAEVVQYVLSQVHDFDAASTVLVGDRKHDIEGAHKNGIPCIGVLHGFGSHEEFALAGADFIVADAYELATLLLE